MSLLSGLLDKIKKEVAEKIGDAAANEILDAMKPDKPEAAEKPQNNVPEAVAHHTGIIVGGGSVPAEPEYEADWYEEVPAEECQYNFEGPYLAYFRKIFTEDFPGYDLKLDVISDQRRYKYTFRKGESVALVVELMTEKSEANSLRRECQKNGVPYLRFYFDHEGWWNTRAYVKERVEKVLG